jgi:hypothetical protein
VTEQLNERHQTTIAQALSDAAGLVWAELDASERGYWLSEARTWYAGFVERVYGPIAPSPDT